MKALQLPFYSSYKTKALFIFTAIQPRTMPSMATQDDYLKTALRLPRELHLRLIDAAKSSSKSMNAEIVERLRASFQPGASTQQQTLDALLKRQDELMGAIKYLQNRLEVRGAKGAKKVGTKP